jgi:enoyl-CoA hydratase|tara:strand:- start:4901 stop:5662 length:762 start_codon:yes stop_codon:yes gene_type:complete
MNKITFNANGKTGTIFLNNPEKLNSFDFEMIKELDRILERIKSSNLNVVVIKGKGKAFCSGGNISWEQEVGDMDINEAKKQLKSVQNIFSKIETMPQIFIAVINGIAVGGGNELAMACDMRIALPNAKFIHPETSLGTVAPLGGTKRLPRLIGFGKAKYMLFTGATIDSKTALEWGLVDFLVSENKIDSFLNDLTSGIAKKPAKALELTKKSVNKDYLKDLQDDFEVQSYVKCSRTKENKEILKKFLKDKKIN